MNFEGKDLEDVLEGLLVKIDDLETKIEKTVSEDIPALQQDQAVWPMGSGPGALKLAEDILAEVREKLDRFKSLSKRVNVELYGYDSAG